jgi:AcrR family transcriptional regulator
VTTSPGLRERKKARTRANIQREALRLFQRDGYAATSVESIAAAADVSPSTFFRYFPTKEDVVLSDFVDKDTIERFVDAPAELDLLEALAHAVRTAVTEMPEEDLALEQLRNRLIRTVPELRRGMLAEMVRPMELFAQGIGRRTGREVDDDVRMFAGAAMGGLMLVTPQLHDDLEKEVVDPDELVDVLVERLTRLGALLRLPEPESG